VDGNESGGVAHCYGQGVKGRHHGRITSMALLGACGLALAAWVPARAAAVPSPPGLPHYGGPSTTGTAAIRSDKARAQLRGADGMPLDGRGTSIAIIDTGIDPTHPAFALPNGGTKLVRSLSSLPCLAAEQAGTSDGACITDLPTGIDSDTGHGGHGSMVSGVAVGNSYTLADGTRVGGVAPGARVVMISSTAALVAIHNGFGWVLQHHAAPCGEGVPASVCPPIRVLSCSWGANDPVITRLEDQLAAQGVLTVWANGNQGGDGSSSNSNPSPSLDPTPGVLTVASFDDAGTGTRDGKVSATSSRGAAANPQTWPDISAPGDNMISACRPYLAVCMAIGTGPKNGPGPTDVGTYNTASGTSFSAPALAGVIAMLFQVDPDATAAHVDEVLELTAYKFRDGAPYHPVGAYTSSFDKGAGLVDAYAAALRMAAKGGDTAQDSQSSRGSGGGNVTQPTAAATVGLPNTAASSPPAAVPLLVAALLLIARRVRRHARNARSPR
jgi:serine protease AprX